MSARVDSAAGATRIFRGDDVVAAATWIFHGDRRTPQVRCRVNHTAEGCVLARGRARCHMHPNNPACAERRLFQSHYDGQSPSNHLADVSNHYIKMPATLATLDAPDVAALRVRRAG